MPVDDTTRLFYRDADEEGAGDPNDFVFACELGEAPAGYVANNADCNDDASAAFGAFDDVAAGIEICDGFDNDCDEGTDVGLIEVGDACTSDLPGVCEAGTLSCEGEAGLVCVPTIALDEQLEVCDGVDNDCDGELEEAADIPELGTACAADAFGICALGSTTCEGVTGLVCEPAAPDDSIDSPDDLALDTDCDGIDGTLTRAVFVSSGGADAGDGTATFPVRTLAQAMVLATADRDQILLDAGLYEANATTRVDGGRTIAWLDVNVQTEGGNGQFVIAVECEDCGAVRFNNVNIVAGDAGAGTPGNGGAAGVNGDEEIDGVNSAFGQPPPMDRCYGNPSFVDQPGGGGRADLENQRGFDGSGALGGLRGSAGLSGTSGSDGGQGGDASAVNAAPAAASGGANTGHPGYRHWQL
jgi:hypothetical protein